MFANACSGFSRLRCASQYDDASQNAAVNLGSQGRTLSVEFVFCQGRILPVFDAAD